MNENRLLIDKKYDWNSLSDLSRDIDDLYDDPQLEAELIDDGGYLKVTIEYIKDDSHV